MSTVKVVNISAVIKKVKEATIGRAAINTAAVNTELTYSGATEIKGEVYVNLQATGGKVYRTHINAFASLRVASKTAKFENIQWSGDLRISSEVSNIQDMVMSNQLEITDGMKFSLTKRFPIEDTFNRGNAQLSLDQYKGYGDYIEGGASVRASGKEGAEAASAYQVLRTNCFASGLIDKADPSKEEMQARVPVFVIKK